MTSTYPKDEFDLAADDMPVGMHRPEPSRWKNVIPFLVILVAVPLFAWSLSQFLTSTNDAGQSTGANTVNSPQSVVPQAQEPQSEPAPEQAASEPVADQPASEPAPETQAAPINYNVAVEVLNGTDVQGLAAEKVAVLNGAGFPGVVAANAQGWLTETTTLYYRDTQIESSAKEIGRLLGVDNLQMDPNLDSNADIVVVLK